MVLHKDIVDMKKINETSSLTFAVDEFSGLLLHPLFYSIIYSRTA